MCETSGLAKVCW